MKITSDSRVSFDPVSLLVDDKRYFPMMGEMHFSRYPSKYWDEELAKMKAGGIDIVSLYVIWIHHEEVKGEYDFTGDRDLRKFLEAVKRAGLYSILRIGPWAHGEARNGGLPDWLLEDAREHDYVPRSDAPGYLVHARHFYEKIYEEAKGFFIKDGGPVIGVQIENEYGHCGGLGGEEGEQHMKTLLAMAKEIGFDVPIYTATGWGGAVTGGMLPVMGGYCEAPWDQRLTEIEPSGNYIFTRERNDHNIGSDHGIGAGITFDMDKFPYLTAELGGGLQVTKHRRPVATGTDTEAMTMVKIGSGANLIGYYMYHGGTNPKGRLTSLQETRETGYPNDLPEFSYDFNAPLREYGQMEDTYRRVRRIGTFIHDFGDDLTDMAFTEQPGNPSKPEDLESLRTAVRYKSTKGPDGKEISRGYLFVNNYQRRYEMKDHENVALTAFAGDGRVLSSLGSKDIKNGDYFFYPFNMPIGKNALLTCQATPLCILHDTDTEGHDTYVFYSENGNGADMDVTGDLEGNSILTITDDEALHAVKVIIGGREHLIVSDAEAVTDDTGSVILYQEVTDAERKKRPRFRIYPDLSEIPEGFARRKDAEKKADFLSSDCFASYEYKEILKNDLRADFSADSSVRYTLDLPGRLSGADEIFASIEYEAEEASLYKDGEKIADNFYTGQEWEIGLKRYFDIYGENDRLSMDVELVPLKEDEKVYLQTWPKMVDGEASRLVNIHLIVQYCIKIS